MLHSRTCADACDCVLTLLGVRLLDVVGNNTPLQDAFLLADDVLRQVAFHAVARLELHDVEMTSHAENAS